MNDFGCQRMVRNWAACFAALLLLGSAVSHAQDTTAIGEDSGRAIPRFISLASDQARMRSHPSTAHAIVFIYLRNGLPMKVLDEREGWRLVEDHDGFQGWMHVSLLSGDRTFRAMVPALPLYADEDTDSRIRAELEVGVVGDLLACRDTGWCRARVENINGWLRADQIWGVLPGETF